MEGGSKSSRPSLKTVLGLSGALALSNIVTRSCGYDEGLDQGRNEAVQMANNCLEAAQGAHLTSSEDMPTTFDPNTFEDLVDLDRLRDSCRQGLGISMSNIDLAVSANHTFPDGTALKINDRRVQVPVDAAQLGLRTAIITILNSY